MLATYANGKDTISVVSPATQRLMLLVILNQIRDDPKSWKQNFHDLAAEIERGELSPEEEILVLDTLITEAVVRGNADAKFFMDAWSARAMELGSHIKTIRFSRAAVLIELGRFAEGKALIENSATPDDRPLDIVLTSIFLARAEAGLGNHERAEELLTEASTRMTAHARKGGWTREWSLLDRTRNAITVEKPVGAV